MSEQKKIRAYIYSGSVRDIKCAIDNSKSLTIERLQWEIEQEKDFKNRSTVIDLFERKIKQIKREQS